MRKLFKKLVCLICGHKLEWEYKRRERNMFNVVDEYSICIRCGKREWHGIFSGGMRGHCS